MLVIFSILFIGYAAVVIYYYIAWSRIPSSNDHPSGPSLPVSIIIPARNESAVIAQLLQALQQQDYPVAQMQVIVVDDHSTDDTAAIAAGFNNVQVIQLQDDNINSYKKKAIATGIAAANGQLIITTDADCIPGKRWVSTLVAFKEKNNAAFIAAPVVIDCNHSIVQVFQSMDFMVLQGITGGAVSSKTMSMCNGANLAYERTVFNEVDGFAGIDHIASGDDMLLMHKITKKYPDRVFYLKSDQAVMHTAPMKSWYSFFQQRIRWASKATSYQDKRIFAVLLLVYVTNLAFPVMAVWGFFNTTYWYYLLIAWIAKTIAELPLFIAVARFFDRRWMILLFPLFQPLHILYTIASGFFGQIGQYEWKGRKVK